MLARSGFYKSGDVEVEKNIIIRCERLGKVFISDEVSWARRFLLCICTSVLLYTIVLNLFFLFTGLFVTFCLELRGRGIRNGSDWPGNVSLKHSSWTAGRMAAPRC